jgi:murein DD-endopeptidase MepM/ murein hydrolase activator NlpD
MNRKAIATLTFFALISGVILAFSYHPYLRGKWNETLYWIKLPFKLAQLTMEPPDRELVIPIENIRTQDIHDTWRAPRPDIRTHDGQDIFAPSGTPIYAAAHGYITRIGWNNLGGNIVLILAAGGHRHYYAHLDSFAPELYAGIEVSTSTLLGYVGNTGNATSTPPHLHFGIYTNQGAIDPLPLFVERESMTDSQ